MTTETFLTIRQAGPSDARALHELAALDSARPLTGDALLAEDGGAAIAAVELASGRKIADPFKRSAAAVGLLELRAQQIR
jgi:hypothetical protein